MLNQTLQEITEREERRVIFRRRLVESDPYKDGVRGAKRAAKAFDEALGRTKAASKSDRRTTQK